MESYGNFIAIPATILSVAMLCCASSDVQGRLQKSGAEVSITAPEALEIVDNISEITTLVREGNTTEASTLFKTLNYNQSFGHIPVIVNSVYAGNLSNVKNTLAFVRRLPKCSQMAQGYGSLFHAMKERKHLRRPEIVLLTRGNPKCDEFHEHVRNNVTEHVTDVLSRWAEQIRSGNHSQIAEFFRKYKDFSTKYSLEYSLPDLVTLTYAGSVMNADNLITFCRSLPTFHIAVVGFEALYTEMEKSGDDNSYQDAFKLAYKIHEALEKVTDSNLIETFTDLKGRLPILVQKIVWGEVCTIKNILFQEYLYQAGKDFEWPTDEKQVFTWLPKDWNPKGESGTEGSWKFVTSENGARFQIINNYWESMNVSHVYMVMDTGRQFDAERRNIVSIGNVSGHKSATWNLEAIKIDNAKGIFYLRSGLGNYFLYPANDTLKYDKDRRRVFALVGTRAVPSSAQWEIDCT